MTPQLSSMRRGDRRALELLDRDRLAVEGGDDAGVLGAVLDAVAVGVGVERVVGGLDLVAVLEAVLVGVGLARVGAELELGEVLEAVLVGVLRAPGAREVVLLRPGGGLGLLGGGGSRGDQSHQRGEGDGADRSDEVSHAPVIGRTRAGVAMRRGVDRRMVSRRRRRGPSRSRSRAGPTSRSRRGAASRSPSPDRRTRRSSGPGVAGRAWGWGRSRGRRRAGARAGAGRAGRARRAARARARRAGAGRARTGRVGGARAREPEPEWSSDPEPDDPGARVVVGARPDVPSRRSRAATPEPASRWPAGPASARPDAAPGGRRAQRPGRASGAARGVRAGARALVVGRRGAASAVAVATVGIGARCDASGHGRRRDRRACDARCGSAPGGDDRRAGDGRRRSSPARRPHPPWPANAPAPVPAISSAIRSAVGGSPRRRRPRRRRPLGQRQRDDRRRRRAQRQPRTVHELAHRALGHAELARDLLLRAPLDRDPQQRLALALGQRGQAGERLAHDRAPLHLLLRRLGAAQRVLELGVVVARDPQLVERGVVDDPVQPRAQVAHLVAALQRAPRRDVRLLERVLGPRLGQIAPRGAQQRAAVALDDRLERPLVPRRARAPPVARRTGCAAVRTTAKASACPCDTRVSPGVTQTRRRNRFASALRVLGKQLEAPLRRVAHGGERSRGGARTRRRV